MPYLCLTIREDPPLGECRVLGSRKIIRETGFLASVDHAGGVALYIEYLSYPGLNEKNQNSTVESSVDLARETRDSSERLKSSFPLEHWTMSSSSQVRRPRMQRAPQ